MHLLNSENGDIKAKLEADGWNENIRKHTQLHNGQKHSYTFQISSRRPLLTLIYRKANRSSPDWVETENVTKENRSNQNFPFYRL